MNNYEQYLLQITRGNAGKIKVMTTVFPTPVLDTRLTHNDHTYIQVGVVLVEDR